MRLCSPLGVNLAGSPGLEGMRRKADKDRGVRIGAYLGRECVGAQKILDDNQGSKVFHIE